jgi:regulatory protein
MEAKRQRAGPRSGRGPRESALPTDPAGRSTVEEMESRAREICLRLLASAPRTRAHLAQAMARRKVPEEVAERVLDSLVESRLVDDVAFANAWVESRHTGRGLARRALSQELRRRGVSHEIVEDAVGSLSSEQEEETARTLAVRRLPASRGLQPAIRLRRVAAMLVRRGYPPGLAMAVVRDALAAEGESVDEDEDAVDAGLVDD